MKNMPAQVARCAQREIIIYLSIRILSVISIGYRFLDLGLSFNDKHSDREIDRGEGHNWK